MSSVGLSTGAVSDVRDESGDSEGRCVCVTCSEGKFKCMCETEVPEGEFVEGSPSLEELEEVLHSAPRSCRHGDEVWPNLYLGDM